MKHLEYDRLKCPNEELGFSTATEDKLEERVKRARENVIGLSNISAKC